jgi:hypothetical protein
MYGGMKNAANVGGLYSQVIRVGKDCLVQGMMDIGFN